MLIDRRRGACASIIFSSRVRTKSCAAAVLIVRSQPSRSNATEGD
jgi:hypothetical protein